jgi:hypothetical protein
VRRLAIFVGTALLAIGCGSPHPSSSSASESTTAGGVLIVEPGAVVQSAPKSEAAAQRLSAAKVLTDQNGADLGYPWLDPSTGRLVLSAATPKGRDLISAAQFAGPVDVRLVQHGAAELQRIQDDATLLAAQGVAGAQLIYETLPDERDNRALIVIRAMDLNLVSLLASRFPADALAVQVRP